MNTLTEPYDSKSYNLISLMVFTGPVILKRGEGELI